jgi:patatin-like phospholipase/acyl hydrolase
VSKRHDHRSPRKIERANDKTIDGGGIRGYSEIIIVEQLMQRVKQELNLPTLPKPCDYFDLICGTSTGGIVAILLGRLRMSVKEVKDVYKDLCEKIFSKPKKHASEGKFSAANLEKLMKETIANCEASNVAGRNTKAERADLPLLEALDKQICKV